MRSTLALLACAGMASACTTGPPPNAPSTTQVPDAVALPAPRTDGTMSVEAALAQRRSVRDYDGEPLALADVSQLLWAAQGVTSASGGRTAPSAGALYPLEVFLVAGAVSGLAPGVYHYLPASHALAPGRPGDLRAELARAAVGQAAVASGSASIVITGVLARTSAKYGERAERYVHMEAGHAAQNVYLQATALELGTVSMGAMADDEVRITLGLAPEFRPLYVLPVGRPR